MRTVILQANPNLAQTHNNKIANEAIKKRKRAIKLAKKAARKENDES